MFFLIYSNINQIFEYNTIKSINKNKTNKINKTNKTNKINKSVLFPYSEKHN